MKKLILIFSLLILNLCCIPVIEKPLHPVLELPPVEKQNQPPVINSIKAPVRVDVSSNSEISCDVYDPEDDRISYSWSCDGGRIDGEGKTVKWIAPESAGDYHICLSVSDGKSNITKGTANVTVADIPNNPPRVSNFIVSAPPPRGEVTIIPSNELFMQPVVTAKVMSPVKIFCVAEDADDDELIYKWTATGGKITDEEGNKMVWIVPSNPTRYIITVVVSDDRGSSATARLAIEVDCCR